MKLAVGIILGVLILEVVRTIIDIIMLNYDKDYKELEEKKDYYGRLKWKRFTLYIKVIDL